MSDPVTIPIYSVRSTFLSSYYKSRFFLTVSHMFEKFYFTFNFVPSGNSPKSLGNVCCYTGCSAPSSYNYQCGEDLDMRGGRRGRRRGRRRPWRQRKGSKERKQNNFWVNFYICPYIYVCVSSCWGREKSVKPFAIFLVLEGQEYIIPPPCSNKVISYSWSFSSHSSTSRPINSSPPPPPPPSVCVWFHACVRAQKRSKRPPQGGPYGGGGLLGGGGTMKVPQMCPSLSRWVLLAWRHFGPGHVPPVELSLSLLRLFFGNANESEFTASRGKKKEIHPLLRPSKAFIHSFCRFAPQCQFDVSLSFWACFPTLSLSLWQICISCELWFRPLLRPMRTGRKSHYGRYNYNRKIRCHRYEIRSSAASPISACLPACPPARGLI